MTPGWDFVWNVLFKQSFVKSASCKCSRLIPHPRAFESLTYLTLTDVRSLLAQVRLKIDFPFLRCICIRWVNRDASHCAKAPTSSNILSGFPILFDSFSVAQVIYIFFLWRQGLDLYFDIRDANLEKPKRLLHCILYQWRQLSLYILLFITLYFKIIKHYFNCFRCPYFCWCWSCYST